MLIKLDRETASSPLQYPVRILQFGEGNFLRAFADWMIDLLNEKVNFEKLNTISSTHSKRFRRKDQ